ncbi:hypothetical protein ACF8OH_04755 [Delftia sp. WSY_9]|uniref:hypothetical protein n=1 Tax=unclassified Delftia TaxID=2613839 RepID=UPI00370C51AF
MDLVYSLLVMIRAHEESDTKSKRVKASIRRLCEGWQNGSYRGRVRQDMIPNGSRRRRQDGISTPRVRRPCAGWLSSTRKGTGAKAS